jgi:hypothetical protein
VQAQTVPLREKAEKFFFMRAELGKGFLTVQDHRSRFAMSARAEGKNREVVCLMQEQRRGYFT